MNKQRDRSLVLMLRAALLAGSAGFALTAAAAPECYQWSGPFSKERFVLDIKKHSDLSRNQHAFSVHGKHVGVCGYETIAIVTGTIVRATPPLSVTGAHMGLRTDSVRATTAPDDGHVIFCKEVTLDCTSAEQSATPKTWTCFGRNEWDVVLAGGRSLGTELTKLNPQDGLCKIFQDSGETGGIPFSPEQVPTPASGDEFSGVLGVPQQ